MNSKLTLLARQNLAATEFKVYTIPVGISFIGGIRGQT